GTWFLLGGSVWFVSASAHFGIVIGLSVASALPFLLVGFFNALKVSLLPAPTEVLMPARITFWADRIQVVTQGGEVLNERYGWIAAARRTGNSIVLSLAHDFD